MQGKKKGISACSQRKRKKTPQPALWGTRPLLRKKKLLFHRGEKKREK